MIELRELSSYLLVRLGRTVNRNDVRIIMPDRKVYRLDTSHIPFGFTIWFHNEETLSPAYSWSRYCIVVDNPAELNNPQLEEYRRILIALEHTLPMQSMKA